MGGEFDVWGKVYTKKCKKSFMVGDVKDFMRESIKNPILHKNDKMISNTIHGYGLETSKVLEYKVSYLTCHVTFHDLRKE